MKVWKYRYDISWGAGQGIVIAETKERARELIHKDPYDKVEALEIWEIDPTKEEIYDFSWMEWLDERM